MHIQTFIQQLNPCLLYIAPQMFIFTHNNVFTTSTFRSHPDFGAEPNETLRLSWCFRPDGSTLYLLQQGELLGCALGAAGAQAEGQLLAPREARGGVAAEQGPVAGHGQDGRDAEGLLLGLHHPGDPPGTVLKRDIHRNTGSRPTLCRSTHTSNVKRHCTLRPAT